MQSLIKGGFMIYSTYISLDKQYSVSGKNLSIHKTCDLVQKDRLLLNL